MYIYTYISLHTHPHIQPSTYTYTYITQRKTGGTVASALYHMDYTAQNRRPSFQIVYVYHVLHETMLVTVSPPLPPLLPLFLMGTVALYRVCSTGFR